MPFPYRILILLCCSTTLFAQASYFGAAVPLTQTRYGALTGKPVLTTNGTDEFVLISTPHNLRLTRLGATAPLARPLLDATDGDAIWTGSHFLVAGSARGTIAGRLIDTNGEPAGAPFTIVAQGAKPRLARDGDRLVLLYEQGGVQSQFLSLDGVAAGTPQLVTESARDYDIAAGAMLLATDAGVKLIRAGVETLVSTMQADAVSLAINGDTALATWSHAGGVEAAVVANGVAAPSFNVASEGASPSLLVHGGATRAAFAANGAMRLAQIDFAGRAAAVTTLAVEGAPEQTLQATASTPNAALVAWNEGGDAHIGIRSRNGVWRERRLASGERALAAASDGNGFVVITENAEGWTAAWLEESGATVRQSPRVTAFAARGVAVNATDALVIGTVDGNITIARAARDGSVSEPVTLRSGGEDPVIASDGTGFLAAWETPEDTIEATRVDGALQRLDANDIVVFEAGAEDPAVAFNGRDYVFVWRGEEFLRARRVGANGVPVDEFVQISRANGGAPHSVKLTRIGDGVGLTWSDGRSQLAVIDFTDGWVVRSARGFEANGAASPHIVALPNHGVAFAHGATNDAAPHYGSARVMMSIAQPARPVAPDAPQATVTKSGNQLRVAWTPPAQAVNGYRVEYRIDGGPWLEYESWSDSGTNEMLVDPRRSGTYQLRVRAFGDGDVSAYSTPVEIAVTASSGKRRAVR